MNAEKDVIVGTLIAGPARCGKTTLAATLLGERGSMAVLTVDALFPVFRSNKLLGSLEERIRFVGDYLKRPRFIDPARKKVRSPADDMGESLDWVVYETMKKGASTSVSLIGAALDTWAEKIGKCAWIAPDLHAEIYFKELIRFLPNLRMIVLLRDPREAVAASLYWRAYPHRMEGGWKVIVYKLLLWCLSAEVGYRLAHAMPDRVNVVFADNLPERSACMNGELFHGVVFPSKLLSNDIVPYFSYKKGRGWLGPDGCWHQLLSDRERCMIEQVSQYWYSYHDGSENWFRGNLIFNMGTRSFLAIILSIARLNPGWAKLFLEFVLFPISQSRRVIFNFGRAFFRKRHSV